MRLGAAGSGSDGGGAVSLPVRSQPQYSGGGSRRAGSVEAGRREASNSGEAAAESEGRGRPSGGPGGRSEHFIVTQILRNIVLFSEAQH